MMALARRSVTKGPAAHCTIYFGSIIRLMRNSGRKIIKILEKNPNKDPDSYDEEDIAHMRKVVAYCKRHLAQEEKAKRDTNSKSYKSLKNWVSIR